jgi:penicillin-binding protein 2
MDRKIGPLFGESISTGKIKRRRYHDEPGMPSGRFYLVPIALVIALILLLGKTFFLQVVQGEYYRNLSDLNRIKTITIYAPRGTIMDRNGKPLVYNVPGFRQTVNGETKLIEQEKAIELLAEGKELEIDSLRQYPYKEFMAHLLGYLGQISEDELKSPEFSSYNQGDLIGKMGIEKRYEKFLKGEDGKQLAEIDSQGKVVRTLGETEGIPGRNIRLTIDADLQKKAYQALKSKRGAVIATTPKGEVLALVSKPSFDPNFFTLGDDYKVASAGSYQNISEVLADTENQPFLNRAISGVYPPGSTFKIITSAAGLENSLIDTRYTVKDTGVIKVGEFSFANWYYTNYGRTDGDVNVVTGLKRSNDIFYYKLAEKVGLTRLSDMAKKFGIDKRLGIDLDGEAVGNVPSDEWKRKVIGEPWYLGDTYNYGIGQGYLLATPLQVNSWAQVIANNGILYKPYLLKELGAKKMTEDFLTSKSIEPIRQGMIESCAPTGVAWPLFDFKVKNRNLKIDGRNILKVATGSADMRQIIVACKTGTSEQGGEQNLPHAWITLFAPAYDPEIVVTVLAEESGEGSNEAGPVARDVLTEWFSSKK